MKQFVLAMVCLISVGLCVAMPQEAQAETATAVVDATRVRIGESLMLEVTADFSGARVEMPELEGFRVSPRGTGSSVQIINGTTTRAVTSRYLLVPTREGAFTIPAIPVSGAKSPVKTQPIAITVLPRDAQAAADDLWYVTAETSTPTPYVGEQMVWTFRFYTAARMRGGNLQRPSFEGFSSEDMGESRSFEKVMNGRRYVVHEVNVLLVPRKAGRQTIEPAMLTASLVVGKRRRSSDPFMDDFFGSSAVIEEKVLSTKPVTVNVKPLPPYKGESYFSGLVGRFSLSAKLEAGEVMAGDPVTLTVTVSGTGNIKEAGAPEIEVPKGMKHYGDTPVEEVALTGQGWSGKKVFKTALVPLESGRVEISPVRLVWFDPALSRYVTSASNPLAFDVKASESHESLEVFQAGGTPDVLRPKEAVKLKGLDILPLKVDADAVDTHGPMGLTGLLSCLGAPMGLFLLAHFFVGRMTRHVGMKETLMKRAQAEIRRAESAISDSDAYHKAIHTALTSVVGAMAGRSMEGVTGDEISSVVMSSTGDDAIAKESAAILEGVEAVRYGGGAQDEAARQAQVALLKRLAKGVK